MVNSQYFMGHFKPDHFGERVSFEITDLLSVYENELKLVAGSYKLPPVDADMAMNEVLYMFVTKDDIRNNAVSFCSLLYDSEEEDQELSSQDERYINEVTNTVAMMAEDLIIRLDEVKLFDVLDVNSLACTLNKVNKHYAICLITPDDEI